MILFIMFCATVSGRVLGSTDHLIFAR